MSAELHTPPTWRAMSFFSRMCYLVNTHQAKDFKDARAKLSKPKPEPQPAPPPPDRRLPYKDD